MNNEAPTMLLIYLLVFSHAVAGWVGCTVGQSCAYSVVPPCSELP